MWFLHLGFLYSLVGVLFHMLLFHWVDLMLFLWQIGLARSSKVALLTSGSLVSVAGRIGSQADPHLNFPQHDFSVQSLLWCYLAFFVRVHAGRTWSIRGESEDSFVLNGSIQVFLCYLVMGKKDTRIFLDLSRCRRYIPNIY